MSYIAAQSTTVYAERAHWTVRLLLLLFVLICIFDPADQVFRAKVPIFIVLWPATLISLVTPNGSRLPGALLAYVLTFIAIPLLSIGWYYFIDGRQPFEGFLLLKGYLLISFAFILALNKVDLIPRLSAVLTVLAVLVIGTFIFLVVEPAQFESLHELGNNTGILSLDRRSFGEGLQIVQVNYVTSSMLVISIAYYFDRAMSVSSRRSKLGYLVLLGINIIGMLLAGTRNNILVSLLLPFTLWPLYTRRVALNALFSLLILVLLALAFAGRLQAFFDAEEVSNSIKLALVGDYMDLFSDAVTLLFGQGLGAYHYWGASKVYFYVTELTYLEMIRNFGLPGAAVLMALLLFPVIHAFVAAGSHRERALAVAYFWYLFMSVSNPHLFSSSGILILAVLVANIALTREETLRCPS